jgi:hypothetical protein
VVVAVLIATGWQGPARSARSSSGSRSRSRTRVP